MHKIAHEIAECLKCKVQGMGYENINGQDLVEFELWTKILKNIACYDKDMRIIKAMDEEEDSEESMRYIEMYEGYPRKGYRGQPRDAMGRYMKRGYEEPPYMHMTPDMYKEHDAEYWRDLDRKDGKLYYTEPMTHGMVEQSRSERARKGYEETKMKQDNSPEGKKKQMESLENYMKELSEDVTDLVGKMDASEKAMLKNKLSVLVQKLN